MGDTLYTNWLKMNGIQPKEGDAPPPPAEGTDTTPPPPAPPVTDDDDLSEEKIIAALKKRGKNINSLDELAQPAAALTDDEKKQQEQQRINQIRAWGLQQNKVNAGDLDRFALDSSKSSYDLVLGLYRAEKIQELKEGGTAPEQYPTEQEITDEFNELYHQDYDDGTKRRKKGNTLIEKEAKEYLQHNYKHIYALDSDYEEVEHTSKARSSYNSTIDKALALVPKELSFTVGEGKHKETYTYRITDELLNKAKGLYAGDEQFKALRSKDLTPAQLAAAIENTVRQEAISGIVQEVAIAHATKLIEAKEKFRRGIPPDDKLGGLETKQTNPDSLVNKWYSQQQKGIKQPS